MELRLGVPVILEQTIWLGQTERQNCLKLHYHAFLNMDFSRHIWYDSVEYGAVLLHGIQDETFDNKHDFPCRARYGKNARGLS